MPSRASSAATPALGQVLACRAASPAQKVKFQPLLGSNRMSHAGLQASHIGSLTNSQHPFGNHTDRSGFARPCGFAPRPYDRFAFIEDEEAAGLSTTSELLPKERRVCSADGRLAAKSRRRSTTARDIQPEAHAFALCLYGNLVQFASLSNRVGPKFFSEFRTLS